MPIPTPRDIVVFLEYEHRHDARLRFAARLAERWQAHLIATFVTRRLELEAHIGHATGAGLSALLAGFGAEIAAARERAREEFEASLRSHGIAGEWRESDGERGEALMLQARHASLAILGPPARQHPRTTVLGLAEGMLFASGRPCLLLPTEWPAERLARRVVVGWNGGREATRAIADAMPLLALADSVHLVVMPEPRSGRLHGEDPGADMAAHLARHGVGVVLEQRPGDDAGAVLLERCAAVDADLLVMGAIGRPRISELVFGGATRTVLREARLPLLMSG